MKNHTILLSLMILGLFSFTQLFSMTLLTKEQALKEMFPDADEVVAENVTLSSGDLEILKKNLGGSLVHFQSGSQSEEVVESTDLTFYYGLKNGEKKSVAIIDQQPGKWGPVEYIIVLDLATAQVKNLAVMSYKEKRGRPIARNSFLKQFIGKGSADPIQVRKDIRAISGATISSDATCFAVKKAIAIVETVILKKEV
jgi:Na+-translocating ferredoxin:NAD+ oxidoreductase RnfG subunit